MIQLSHSVQTAHKQALLSSSTISFEPALALAWEQSKAGQENYTEENFLSNASLCPKRRKKKEKSFPLTERMRRNGFEICDLQTYESVNLFFSSDEVQYMIKTLPFTSLMTPEQALMAALGQVPEPY